MQIWVALVGGIILGWIAEWVVDWLYWRRGIAGFYAREQELEGLVTRTEASRSESEQTLQRTQQELAGIVSDKDALELNLNQKIAQLAADKGALEQRLRDEITALQSEKSTLEQQLADALAQAATATRKRRDDLEQIDGVGPVFEQKLFAAGIDSYAQLAATPPERLREIIQPQSWQHIDFEDWIEQARRFAAIVVADVLPYRLEEIRGIGPTYAKRLNQAGIMTFADLAKATEKQLREAVAHRGGLNIDYADWIRQARAFVALTTGDRPPLPLEQIKGIGPVFATRLDLAGVHTFADLAKCTDDELREIIGREIDAGELAEWIAEAKVHAGQGTDGAAPSPSTAEEV